MTIIEILQYPDSRLHRKAYKINDVKSASIQKIIDNMFETLANTNNCAALAATQLDIELPPAITVVNSPIELEPPFCLLNPEIIASSGRKSAREGCMSIYVDDVSAIVERAAEVTVRALDREGNEIEIIAKDFLAKCLQHEIDHLHGVLYLDRISKLKRLLIEKKINKLKH